MNEYTDKKSDKPTPNESESQQNGNTPWRKQPLLLEHHRTRLNKIREALIAIIKSVQKMFQSDPNKKGTIKSDMKLAFSSFNLTNTAVGGFMVILLLYFVSGIFVVNPGEKAVVKLFGKPVNTDVGEGIHYRMPWPFQTVNKVNISTIRREGIGLILPEHKAIHSTPEKVQFLTGDNNIIDLQAVVQYRVKDAAAYLYNINYPAYQLINETIRSAITEIGGGIGVDDILTIGKERLQDLIRIKVQELLDIYHSGIQVVGINFNKVYPPEDVAEAFRDVSNANQDKEKSVNDAWGYRNSVIPQARGESEKLVREAEAYKISSINEANGEAGRFDQILYEYEKDQLKFTEDVTATRLYMESMEKILQKVKKIIVNPNNKGELNLNLLKK